MTLLTDRPLWTGPMTTPPPQVLAAALDLAQRCDGADDVPAALLAAAADWQPCHAILGGLLYGVVWRHPDSLHGHLTALTDAEHARQSHGATCGHDVCCGWECPCAPRERCEDCESDPHQQVDDACGALLALVSDTVGAGAVERLFATAGEQ